jgi:hypothetical protein
VKALLGVGTYKLTINNINTNDGAILSPNNDGRIIECGTGLNKCAWTASGGSSITLDALPNTGALFTGWSGAGVSCPGSGTCAITLTSDITLDAGFCTSGTFSLLPQFSTASFGAASGSFSVAPVSGSCSSWAAGSMNPWLTITSGANGSGGGAVGYSAVSGPELHGVITAAGQQFDLLRVGTGGLDAGFNYHAGKGFGYISSLAAALGSISQFTVKASALQTDGKVVLTGYESPDGVATNLFVARLNQDGTKDTGFAVNAVSAGS